MIKMAVATEDLFDESILTDVQEILESLHTIYLKRYIDTPMPHFSQPIELLGVFASYDNANEKLPVETPTAGTFYFTYNTLLERDCLGKNKINKRDRLVFDDCEYEIKSVQPMGYIVINHKSIPVIYACEVINYEDDNYGNE